MSESSLSPKIQYIGDSIIVGYMVQGCLEFVHHLSEEELKVWNNEKKYRAFNVDWLAGRAAAKLAVQKFFYNRGVKFTSLSSITINNNQYGAPYVSDCPVKCKNLLLTISHSFGCGVAFCTDSCLAIGCDIEVIKKRNKIMRYFLSPYEQKCWNEHFLSNQYEIVQTIAWAAKEASIKCIYNALIIPDIEVTQIEVIPTTRESFGFRFSFRHIQGEGIWTIHDKYILTLAKVN